MSGPLQVSISSNAAIITADLQRFPAAMQLAIAKSLDLENELTVGAIQEQKLSQRGPTTLGVRSNRLRSSMRRTAATVTPETVESSIGTNVRYMKPHEFGFEGDVQVPAHKRRIIAYDRYRQTRGGNFVKTQSGIPGLVRAHTMHLSIPARAPIRTTIQERSPRYSAAISGAIVTAWPGGATS